MDLSGKVGGYVDADVSLDRDILAAPVGIAELDISQSLSVTEGCQHLDFTVVVVDASVDIDRTARITYRLGLGLGLGLRLGLGIGLGLGLGLGLAFGGVNGGSIDRHGEDSADDDEELSGEHHGAS